MMGITMENKNEFQIPCKTIIAEHYAKVGPRAFIIRLKRTFARPWNYYIKREVRKYSDLLFTSFAGTLIKPQICLKTKRFLQG
jgi:hypothetical protein